MITNENGAAKLVGLSTDAKPTNRYNGAKFTEIDTGDRYMFDGSGKQWYKQPYPGTGRISQKLDAQQKSLDLLWKLTEGNVWDTETDTDAAYSKTVPSGAVAAEIGSIGGKTVVWNQLVDTDTEAVATVSGRKYLTIIDGDSAIVTGDGADISVSGGTDKVFDLTLMSGANVPSTTSDPRIPGIIAYAEAHQEYNAGELLSAEVTEIKSVGKNMLNLQTALTTQVQANNIPITNPAYTIQDGRLKCAYYLQSFGRALFVIHDFPAGDFALSYTVDAAVENSVSVRKMSGEREDIYPTTSNSTSGRKSINFSVPQKCDIGISLMPNLESGIGNFSVSNILLERGSTATAYAPYMEDTLTIPAALIAFLADKDYGASAGAVSNTIDWAAKTYTRRVKAVDMGSLDYTRRTGYGANPFFSTYPGRPKTYANNLISAIYSLSEEHYFVGFGDNAPDMSIAANPGTDSDPGRLLIRDDRYATADEIKAGLAGVILHMEIETPEVYDISEYLPDDNMLDTEPGGSLTFVQEDDTTLEIPNSVDYLVKLSEVETE